MTSFARKSRHSSDYSTKKKQKYQMSCFKVDVKRARRNSIEDLTETERIWGKGNPDYDGTLSIVVVGASGNLAMLKV